MSQLYYCINDVLDSLEKFDREKKERMNSLIKVSSNQPDCAGYPDDAFILSSSPNLLDIHSENEARKLADLLETIPLYHINMELIIDEALAERHHNAVIDYALNQAFVGQPIPSTLQAQKKKDNDDVSGNLRHPMIGHLDKTELSKLYIKFLSHLRRDLDHYAFEKSILGKHTGRFIEYFDGFVAADYGMVKALILIAFGMRVDHYNDRHNESHIEEGLKKARAMRIEDPLEIRQNIQ
jgi:hypothetical protein